MGVLRDVAAPRPAWPPPADRDAVRQTLAYARRRDPYGHAGHVGLALAYLATLPLATAPSGVAFATLLVLAVARLHCTWRAYLYLLRDSVGWLLLALIAWKLITLLWTPVPADGWSEIWTLRVVATSFAIWPVIDRLPWMIGAFLVGVAGQHGVQLAQAMEWFGLTPEVEPRLGGLVHPIVAAMMCLAAMCWHLGALVRSGGWLRWVSAMGAAAGGLGLLASGSRGPWIAALVVLPPGLAMIAWRRPETRRTIGVIAVAAVVLASAAWPLLGDRVASRVDDAVVEIRDAVEDDVYVTSTGLRLAMWSWAWDIFLDAPVRGAGAGSFLHRSAEQPSFQRAVERWPDRVEYLEREHPHNVYLHLMSTTGLIGFGLFLAVAAVTLRRCWLDQPDHIYTDGTLLVVAAWLIGSMFDCYNLNGNLFGLLIFCAVVTLPHRPTPNVLPPGSGRTDEPQ